MLTTTDHQWLSLWQNTPDQSPFAHSGYLSLWEDDKTRALAAVFRVPDGHVFYPFLLRDLRKESFWNPAIGGEAFDITSPYGYGGPEWVPDVGAPEASAEAKDIYYHEFFAAFRQWAIENKVVSEFVRFSLFSEAWKHYSGRVEHNNDNVVVDLARLPGEAWKDFNNKVRKNVRTAIRNNLTALHDPEARHLDEFMKVYYHTLERRHAAPFYFFSKQWFEKLCLQLNGRYSFFHIFHNGEIIASELVLLSRNRIYSFLGGTLHTHYHLRPSDYLKYFILEWGREAGYQQFVIGGGHKPHDGIFAFKKSFTPEGAIPFYTGKMTFDPATYQKLTAKGQADEGFFPAYRTSR